MENASKALLIAAAVLIVILLIAFGIRIFNSTGNSSEEAKKIGGLIQREGQKASASAISELGKSSSQKLDKESFNAELIANSGNMLKEQNMYIKLETSQVNKIINAIKTSNNKYGTMHFISYKVDAPTTSDDDDFSGMDLYLSRIDYDKEGYITYIRLTMP